MKKLLIYSDCFIFGGSENVVVNLMRSAAVRQRFEVRFAFRSYRAYDAAVQARLGEFTVKPLHILSDETRDYEVKRSRQSSLRLLPFHLLRRTGVYFLWNVARLYSLFRTERPDVLHINNGGYPGAASCRHAVIAARLAGVRRVVFMVNSLAYPPGGPIDRWMDGQVRTGVHRFVTASQAAAERLATLRGMPRDRIDCIPNTLPSCNVTKSREEVRASLGLNDSHFVLACIGTLTEEKGQAVLLRAIASLANDAFRVLIVGDGEDGEQLKSLAKTLGIASQAIFTGQRPDAHDLLNASDVLVHPSFREDMPYVILEALCLGRPVIGTRVGGIPEEIRDGVEGLLVEPRSEKQLAAAIAELFRDREKTRQIGVRAAERFREEFRYDLILRRFADLYSSL